MREGGIQSGVDSAALEADLRHLLLKRISRKKGELRSDTRRGTPAIRAPRDYFERQNGSAH